MAVLSRQAILDARPPTETVAVPEWGGDVIVRALSVNDANKFGDIQKETAMGALIVASVVDEAGQPVFTEADIPALQEKSFAALKRVQDAVLRVSGMDQASPKDSGNSSSATA